MLKFGHNFLMLILVIYPLITKAERLGTDGFVYMPTWIYEVTIPDKYTNEPTSLSDIFIELTLRMPGSGSSCVILPYKSDIGPIFERTVKCEDGNRIDFVCDGATDKIGDNEGKTCEQTMTGRFTLKLVIVKYYSFKENERRQAEFELNHPHSY